jgi:hypothetical protein
MFMFLAGFLGGSVVLFTALLIWALVSEDDDHETATTIKAVERSSALDAYRERQRLEVERLRMDTADELARMRAELDRDLDRLG